MRDIDSQSQPTTYTLSRVDAGRILGCSRQMVARLIAAGHLSQYRIPGGHPRLRRDEVEALAARSIYPAKQD